MKQLALCTLFIFFIQVVSGQILINEVSNANASILTDADGDQPDWIELYNSSPNPVNLAGYELSDKKSQPMMWVFPSYQMQGNSFMTVFASAKNRIPTIDHFETAVWPNFLWSYLVPDANTSSLWNTLTFDAGSWQSGQLGIGYGDSDDVTDLGGPITSAYVRYSFNVTDTSKIASAILDIDYDDGFAAYLNGIEIARSGLNGTPPLWDELSADHEATIYQGVDPQRFSLDDALFRSAIQNGNNVLAIEVHNVSTVSSDLSLIPYLTFGFRDATLFFGGNVHPYFNVGSANEFHTNFSIKASGEGIYLSDNTQQIIDSLTVPDLDPDVTFGRQNDGSASWYYLLQASPGMSNNGIQAFTAIENQPIITTPGGFHPASCYAKVTNTSALGGIVRYTLNGQTPDSNSPVFVDSVFIDQTHVLKARCFPVVASVLPSETATETFFILDDFTLPVISITTDDVNLYGADGIFDNSWSDWKKPCYFEYFDSTGTKITASKSSIKPDGGAGGSRSNPQHSVTLEPSHGVFGSGEPIHYPLIPEKSFIQDFHAFYLRNGSNYWNQYPQKDATFMRVMRETNAGSQAYSPVVVYLNGDYFGVYELREKANSEYFEVNYGNDPDSLDLLSVSYFYGPGILRTVEGSDTGFYNMRDYITGLNPALPDFFQLSNTKLDLYNFADYIAGENWFGNQDWIYNNMKIARTQTAGNKWRFWLQDMELGLGGWGDFNVNIFDYFRYNNQPNAYWDIYNGLMQNNTFHDYFINRYADLMNTTLQPAHYVPIVNSMYEQLVPEMPRHFQRWTGDVTGGMQAYSDNYSYLLYQMFYRNDAVRNQIQAEFSLNQQVDVTLNVLPAGAGYIKISTIVPENLPWTGVYFDGVPVQITAVANPGFTFATWEANNTIPAGELNQISLTKNITSDDSFVALFHGSTASPDLTISEINYNCDSSLNGGNWIELHNFGTTALSLDAWSIQSKNHWDKYEFPLQTSIPANGYLVVCEDTNLFKQQYPNVSNFIGSTTFPWSNDEDSIKIYNAYKDLMVTAVYSDLMPYPECADGLGRTLELFSNSASLLAAESWFCGCIKGSPGEAYTPCNEGLYITEINYNNVNATYDAGDWIEIKNNGTLPLSLLGYRFKDSKNSHTYVLPDVTIPPGGYWVLYANQQRFENQHPNINNKSGIFDFGLNASSEILRFYDQAGILQTSMLYKNTNPWPSSPSTSNYTLERIDTLGYVNANNGLSWFAGCLGGSPGEAYISCEGDLEPDFDLFLYPNPNDGNFIIQFNNADSKSKELTIRICDIRGSLVFEFQNSSTKNLYSESVDVSELASGIYFVSVLVNDAFVQLPFVKL